MKLKLGTHKFAEVPDETVKRPAPDLDTVRSLVVDAVVNLCKLRYTREERIRIFQALGVTQNELKEIATDGQDGKGRSKGSDVHDGPGLRERPQRKKR